MNVNVNMGYEDLAEDESNNSQLVPRKKHLAAGLLTLGILLWLAVAGGTHANFDRLARVTAPGCGQICSRFPQFERAFCLERCLLLPAHMNKCEACHEVCRRHGGQRKACKNACKHVCPPSKLREYLRKKAKGDVMGGSLAGAKSFPTIVALYVFYGGSYVFFCGGTVSSTQDVLTAGHCCEAVTGLGLGAAHLKVVAGDLSRSSTTGNEQTRFVTKMTRHPNYITETNSAGTRADLCVLNLNTPLTMNDYVIFLIPGTPNSAGGEACKFAGWGSRTGVNGGAVNDLYSTSMTTITDSSCQSKLGKTVYSDNVCAYHPSAGACVGDSGGPLVRDSDGQVLGVVSWGSPCLVGANNPTAFTEVATYYTWINQTGVGETCVSARSIVRVREDSGVVKLAQLSEIMEGDKIETIHGYEQVYFVVRSSAGQPVAMTRMVIQSECGGERATISLTKEHLLFDGAGRLTRADKFSVGDVVSLRGCEGRVVNLSESMEEPISVVTDSGEFVLANGVRVSTYSFSAAFAKFIHALTSPLRAVSRIFGKNVGSWVGQVLGLDRALRPSVLKGFVKNGEWMSIL